LLLLCRFALLFCMLQLRNCISTHILLLFPFVSYGIWIYIKICQIYVVLLVDKTCIFTVLL
jgi:hypothetical protein